MTKIDVFSGFLGSGKTTLIKKLVKEAYAGQKVVLIENEFGEIGIDGGFMKDAGIEITEMNSGCICCSLVGDFGKALEKVLDEINPDRILIEPSGVGKLSDVLTAIGVVDKEKAQVSGVVTVVDANKFKVYSKNFGEFFFNQIESAPTIILSHVDGISDAKLADCVAKIKEKNPSAVVVTTSWDKLTGEQILTAISKTNTLEATIDELAEEHKHHHHHHHDECGHHHHDDDDKECCCGHHHHDDDDDDDDECECGHHHHHHDDDECGHHHHDDDDKECCCGHHHHDDDEDDDDECECGHHHHHHDDDECECGHHHHHHDDDECECGHHHHHHDDDEECSCGCGHHHHHHGHDADEVFTSWGKETTKKFTVDGLTEILEDLIDESKYGMILRAKGIVEGEDGSWIHFDYVPGEPDVRVGSAEITGRLCVIGSKIKEDAIEALFLA